MVPVQPSRCEVVAASLDEAGAGVGVAADGTVVHAAGLLPTERAEVAIDHRSPHKAEAWGQVARRIGAPSEDRVEPACPAYGRCGGCPWQHLAYPAQLVAKRARVVAALDPALGAAVAVADTRPSPAVVGYRNKGKYVAGADAHGRLVLGAYAPRTHEVVDTLGCKQVAPIIDEVAAWLRGAAEDARLVPYVESARTGELRYAIVREAHGDVLVVLVTSSACAPAKLERVAAALAKHPAVRGVVAIAHDRRDGAIVPSGSSSRVLYGTGALVDDLAGVPIEIGAAEFVQVNRAQASAMYARVAELANVTPRTRAVDLYAGLGGMGLALARAGAAAVVAVEIDREAVARLARAAAKANLPVTAIAGDAGDLPSEIRAQLGDAQPDVVVVNPPRKGLGEGARDLVIALAAKTVIYASCGPESLGRDLAALAQHGYRVDVVEPFDLMPGTAQIETVVRLERR